MTTPYGIVSNRAKYSYASGWTAQIVYCVAAADVAALVAANYLSVYANSAGTTNLVCVAIDDEPWMEGDVVAAITGYSNSRRVTFHYALQYLDVPWPANITRPAYLAGTTLKLHIRHAGQHQPIHPAAIKPAAAGPAVAPNTQLSQYIALNEYIVQWDRVQDLADLAFTGFIGAVNSDTFMSCVPGTLLCVGAPQEPSYVLNPSNPFAWKTSVNLKQRMIVVAAGANAGTYGWNDWFNPKTQAWESVALTNGQPQYPAVAFAGMFS